MNISSSLFFLLAMAGIVNSKVIADIHKLADIVRSKVVANFDLHAEAPEESNQPGRNEIRNAVCHMISPNENITVTGQVLIKQNDPMEPVTIIGNITVTTKEDLRGKHGFHIHQFSVPNGICTEAGGHYNPYGKEHGGPEDKERHVGDLGNILFVEPSTYGTSKANYTSNFQLTDSLVTLYGDYSVVGRAIVIHKGEDDLGKDGHDDSKTTGHAGARIACCNINLAILKNKEEKLGCDEA